MSVSVETALQDWAVERLEAEIAVGSAHLAAAECRWLQLVAEFDRREAWRTWGCLSAAHWLNHRCGLALGPAREKVRVARRLEELPLVVAAFSTGELSYSKIRALTRVATHANEETLVDLARAMTASHLERVVRTYRQIPDDDSGRDGNDNETGEQRRRLDYRWTADAMLEIRALLPAEEGALVLAALRRAGDHLFRHSNHQAADDRTDPAGDAGGDVADDVPARTPEPTVARGGDVPAGTPEPTAGGGDAHWSDSRAASLDMAGDAWDEAAAPSEVPPEGWEYDFAPTADDVSARTPDAGAERDSEDEWRARQADALVAMADTVVADGLRPGSGPSRYHVVIHLNTTADPATPAAWTDDGPILDADTARRLMCDASMSFALHGADGTVVNVSARAPTVPAALSRAVKLRDDGCVFPGCTRRGHTDLHHLHHRAYGGANSLINLACLCRAHHRMIHDDGYRITSVTNGTFEFYRPDGTPITKPVLTVPAGDKTLRGANTQAGVNPGEESQTPDWDGTRPNYAMIIEHLLYVDGRLHLGT